MRIRSTVKLATVLIIGVVLLYSAFALLIDRAVDAKYRDLQQASHIRVIFNRLRSLTTDYFLYQTERAHQQWWTAYGSFLKILKTPEWQTFQREYGLEDLGDRAQAMGAAFSKLTVAMGKTGLREPEAEAHKEFQNGLMTQIMVAGDEIDTSLNKIFEDISRKTVSLQHQSSGLSIAALLILIAFIVANALFLSRSVVQPVLQLHEIVKIIGRGNLDYRVGTAGPGEIRDLSRAFNEMTANLKKSQEDLRHLASKLITAQEKERQYVGLELHDDLGQLLMVLKMQLRALQKNLPPESMELRGDLENVLNFVNEIIERVRRLSRNLRPAVLEDMGLSTGLKLLFEDFQKYHDLELTVDQDDIDNLFPWEHQILIYRIFQESLTNVARHAGATQVALTIKKRDDRVVFQMWDNGCGFNLQEVLERNRARRGLGLAALDERVRMLGGELQLWSQPDQGTRLNFTVPVAHPKLSPQARNPQKSPELPPP
jgi:signal transduction histidine kinase